MSIENKIIEMISKQMRIAIPEITASKSNDDLGMDSLDDIEFIMALEEEFDIEIDDAEAEKLALVSDVVALVGKKLLGIAK